MRSRCAPVACALHRSAPCRRPRAARVARSLHHWRSRLRAPRRWLPPLVALCRWPPGIIRRRRACSARCGARCSCRGDARRSSRPTTRQRSECGGREPAACAPTCSGAAPAPARAAAHGAQTRAPPVGVRLQAPCHAALAAPTHAALLGASHCCPPCRSRRVRQRPSLRVILPPGVALQMYNLATNVEENHPKHSWVCLAGTPLGEDVAAAAAQGAVRAPRREKKKGPSACKRLAPAVGPTSRRSRKRRK